jgi:hypothetical protein
MLERIQYERPDLMGWKLQNCITAFFSKYDSMHARHHVGARNLSILVTSLILIMAYFACESNETLGKITKAFNAATLGREIGEVVSYCT